MNFVADDEHIVLYADVTHSLHFLLIPYAAARIVGITEQEEFAAFDFLFKIGKINLKLTVYQFQRTCYKSAPKVECHMMVRMIHRRLDEHLVTGLCKALQCKRNCRYNAAHEAYFLGLHLPTVATRME